MPVITAPTRNCVTHLEESRDWTQLHRNRLLIDLPIDTGLKSMSSARALRTSKAMRDSDREHPMAKGVTMDMMVGNLEELEVRPRDISTDLTRDHSGGIYLCFSLVVTLGTACSS